MITGREITKVLLFATEEKQVMTHGYEGESLQRLLKAHATLGQYLELSGLALAEDGAFVKESIVKGLPFHFAAPPSRDQAFRSLVRSYTALTEQRANPPLSSQQVDDLVATVYEQVRSHAFGGLLAAHRAEIMRILASAANIASHGDLHGDNVLVGRGEPKVIDLDEFALRPFFFDLLTLPLHRTAKTPKRYHFFDDLLSGSFDEELDALCKLVGSPPFSCNRAAYFFSTLVVRLHVGIKEAAWPPTTAISWLNNALPRHELFGLMPSRGR